MPVISMFFGIIIRMYAFDEDRHKAAHIHVQYAEQLKLVQAWIEIHQEELMAN